MLEYMIEDLPEYKSRGERIMSVLNGSGSVDVLPGRPDVQASDSDFRKAENYYGCVPHTAFCRKKDMSAFPSFIAERL